MSRSSNVMSLSQRFCGQPGRCCFAFVAAILSLFISTTCNADVLCSWNLKRLGHDEADKSYRAIARVVNLCDFIAIQEVMTPNAIDRLNAELDSLGGAWESMTSDLIGRGRYKEAYTFLWRKGRVEYVDQAVVYLDRADIYARDPFSARFKLRSGQTFAAASIHVLYGNGPEDRAPEIAALADYWKWLSAVYPKDPIILMGDFNTEPSESVWRPLKAFARPLITQGKSTLSKADGRYAHLYDNIWISQRSSLPVHAAGVIPYPQLFNAASPNGMPHQIAFDHISDHAPVFVSIGSPFDPMRHMGLDRTR